MAIATVLEEISAGADAQNATVIGEAFRLASIKCEACQYPQNAQSFHETLISYTSLRKQAWRLWRRHRLECEWTDTLPWFGNHESFLKEQQPRHWAAMQVERWNLDEMWPCDDCLERYNPTDKRSDYYPPHNRPKGKGFTE